MAETFIVKRSEWERGIGNGDLYNETKKYGCILGLYLIAHGADPEDLNYFQRPKDYFEECGQIDTPIELIVDNEDYDDNDGENIESPYRDSDWTIEAMDTNDTAARDDDQRERVLVEHFAVQGCDLQFVD